MSQTFRPAKWRHLVTKMAPFGDSPQSPDFGAIWRHLFATWRHYKQIQGLRHIRESLTLYNTSLTSPPPEQGTPERAFVPETPTKQQTHPIVPQTNLTPTYLHSAAILHTASKTLSCNPDETSISISTVKTALAKCRMKRKRVNKKLGEILTPPSVLKRLKEADQERSEKANTKGKVGPVVNKRKEYRVG